MPAGAFGREARSRSVAASLARLLCRRAARTSSRPPPQAAPARALANVGGRAGGERPLRPAGAPLVRCGAGKTGHSPTRQSRSVARLENFKATPTKRRLGGFGA